MHLNRKRTLLIASGILALLLAAGIFGWRQFYRDPLTRMEELWASRPASASKPEPIPGSVSPDGKWMIVRFEFGASTADVCFVFTDRGGEHFGGIVHVFESDFRSTSRYHAGTTLLWSPDSRHFAMHDRGPKHSVPTLHRVEGGQLIPLPVRGSEKAQSPNAAGTPGELLSSGFRLKQWSSNTRLEMDAILRAKDGETIKSAALQIESDSAAIVP
jgi:hypothetical protein